jgi:hypothetical protein
MFDLDKSVSEWRQRMISAGVKNPAVLDELENHVREDSARRVQSGAVPETAFEAAAREIGEAQELKTEFAKSGRPPEAGRTRMWYASVVVLVGLILFVSGGTIFHLQMPPGEQMMALTAVIVTLMVACGWRHAVSFLPLGAIRQRVTAIGPVFGFYLKAGGFVMPAALVWFVSAMVLMPKLREMCYATGTAVFDFANDSAIGNAWAKIAQGMIFLTAHDLSITGAAVVFFVLLEWRSSVWRRYRRAAVGTGIYVFNFAVLLSLMLMIISALIGWSSLASHVK